MSVFENEPNGQDMREKKKLLYVVRYPLYEGFHLKQKFDGQLKAFENLGFDVYFIGFDKKHFYLINGDHREVIGNTHFNLPYYFHTFLYVDLYNIAYKVVKKEHIDVIYYRSAAVFRSFYKMLSEAKRQSVSFLYEIPTYAPSNPEKDQNILRRFFRIYSGIWERKSKSLPDIYIFMGDGHFTTFNGTKAIRIENGISPEIMPLRLPKNDKSATNILALSSMCYWHGYDRLIRSLAEYDGKENVVLHIVGGNDGKCLNEWQKLVDDFKLSDKVVFHGSLYGSALNEMFNLCDIGVNSLGMYRKGMVDTSELKMREYMARGLPFVCSVYDVALNGLDQSLYYQVPNDDSIPSMEKIVDFAKRIKATDDAPSRLRDHAIKTMTWEAQYRKVFEQLEDK